MTEQPPDAQGRLLLNGYGRQCYDLGYAAAVALREPPPPPARTWTAEKIGPIVRPLGYLEIFFGDDPKHCLSLNWQSLDKVRELKVACESLLADGVRQK